MHLNTLKCSLFLPISAALIFGPSALASTTRDTTFDHRLPAYSPPILNLAHYRPVQERPNQDPHLAVAMAISGGGHRAANFAIGVLLGLESFGVSTNPCNLLKEIDYFSTVSGGGFAAGAYLASRYDHQMQGKTQNYSLKNALEDHDHALRTHLERDYQTTLLGAGAGVQLFGYKDVGDLIEQQFDNCILGAEQRKNNYSIQLGDVFRRAGGTTPVSLPYWFANATVYENGARFVFTPDMLEKYHVRGFTHRMKDMTLTESAYLLPLAVAIKTSASFPVAIPATTFTCDAPNDPLNRYLHLMDGGLIDNLGVNSAFDALEQTTAKRRILLVVDAYKGDARPLSKTKVSPAGIQAAYRVTRIALDSDHSLLRRHVLKRAEDAATANRGPIDVVFLSFEDLKPNETGRIENIKKTVSELRKTKADAILRRVQREINTTLVALEIQELELETAQDEYALYHDTRAIATSLNITPAEQTLLFKAGKSVVNTHRDTLEKLFR